MSDPPNKMSFDYNFKISEKRDTTPPYTEGHDPNKNQKNISPQASITVHVKDDFSGVDRNTVEMMVNHQIIEPVITGSKYDYLLKYKPVEEFTI